MALLAAVPTHMAKQQRKPENVPKGQEWYWSKQWQEWERQADEELARGESVVI
jgi:hypothetical protein